MSGKGIKTGAQAGATGSLPEQTAGHTDCVREAVRRERTRVVKKASGILSRCLFLQIPDLILRSFSAFTLPQRRLCCLFSLF